MERKRSLGFAHYFLPTYPGFLYGAPPTPACAAFIKESRMKFANASKIHRKSGVRSGERGAPVLSPEGLWRNSAVVVALEGGEYPRPLLDVQPQGERDVTAAAQEV